MLAMLVAQTIIQVAPVAASVVPIAPAAEPAASAPLGATPWVGTGATNPAFNDSLVNDPTSFTITHDGTTGLAQLDYNFNPPAPGASPSGRWTFTTTADATTTESLHWNYSGFHGWCGASIGLHAVVIRSGDTVSDVTLANATDPCNYSFPSGGFNVSGDTTVAVQAGDTFGFIITGTNYNLSPLSGSLTVAPRAVYVATSPVASGGGSCAEPDFNSIQGAVDASPAGSTIHICPNTYYLNGPIAVTNDLVFEGDDAATTILDGSNDGHPVQIIHAPGQLIQVRSLTLQNGHSATYGGAIEAGSVVASNSVFVNNDAYSNGGAIGAGLLGGGDVTVTNSDFDSNTVSVGSGGAIRAYKNGPVGGTISVSGSTFEFNSAGWGGALAGDGLNVVATSTFADNHATNEGGSGGAIIGPATVSGSTFDQNHASVGGAISSASSQDVAVTNSTFIDNVANVHGGAIDGGGKTTVTNTTFLDNTGPGGAPIPGAAIYTYTAWSAGSSITNTILAAPTGMTNCTGPNANGGGNFSTDGCIGTTASLASLHLGPLNLNGGPTPTVALLNGSAAIDHGVGASCPATDQRGVARPLGGGCDSGAFEATGDDESDTPQEGPGYVVNTTDDHDDDVCGTLDCSLREAIKAHNAGEEGVASPIDFDIAGDGLHRIVLTGALPAIQRPAIIASTYTPGPDCATPDGGLRVEIDGSHIDGGTVDGLAFTPDANASSIFGLIIDGFSGNGIRVTGSSGESGLSYLRIGCNVIGTADLPNGGSGIHLDNVNGGWIGGEIDPNEHAGEAYDNVITHNGDDGITYVWTSSSVGRWGVRADSNVISDNGDLAIDLGADGPTPNDVLDVDQGANDLNNAPVLFRAESGTGPDAGIAGQINTSATTRQDVTLYLADSCDLDGSPQGGTILGTLVSGSATFGGVGPTDATGVANFTLAITALPVGKYVTATATNDRWPGSTSEFSNCVRIGTGNDSWPNALDITNHEGAVSDVISYPGQSRWYKVVITPGEQVSATVANAPTSNILLAFKDIQQAYDELQAASLTAQTAESSGGSTTGKFSGGTGTKFSAGTGTKFSAGTGTKFSGGTGTKFAGDLGFAAGAFSGGTGTKFAGGTGTKFAPVETAGGTGTKFSPESYSGAQVSSLVAFNDTSGLAPKSVVANTWNNGGYYYIRVSAEDGAFNPSDTFDLTVSQTGGACGSLVNFSGTALGPLPGGTNLKSVILLDSSRIAGTAAEKAALAAQLATFAGRAEVGGVVVDLKNVARINDANDAANDAANVVNDLNDQADKYPACPYAKNLLADAIKGVVDSYRAGSPNLAYVVLVGGDSVIPFYRYPDEAEIAPETAFYPPVAPTSSSEASLRLNYVLSQDAYGAKTKLNVGAATFPVTDLAVGRLVETASEASGMLDAYLNHTNAGVVSTPTSSLATGYDFMADSASSVATDFAAGIGSGGGRVNDTLINETWTAPDLAAKLLGSQRHDLVFLAGHFSANRALAADQNTTVSTTDLVASQTDFQNTIVFSQGCHSGYGIVDDQGIQGVTQPLDWAQAFSQKRATLIAGTGYQYGDTDLIQYSELIYASFAKELRTGSGPVAVGQALVAAKKDYLRATPDIGGTDTKALLQSTLYGLPMLSVNLPGARITPPPDPTTVAVTPVADGPGKPVASGGLGLQTAPVNLTTTGTLTPNPTSPPPGTPTWLSGPNGVAAQPYQPVLPLILKNVTVGGQTLRGVGFMGGTYGDTPGVKPLVSIPATEQKGAQTGFSSPTFYPAGIASVSYFDALGNGATRLLVTPVQHRADSATTATRRVFSGLQLQLFYSSFTGTKIIDGQTFRPSLAAAPSIVDITATESGGQIKFDAHVSGDPSAGIQKVWVSYTGFDNTWTSLDLNVDPLDPTHFTRTLAVPGGHTASQLLFMIQAVSGTGLVSADTNDGALHTISPAVPPVQQTTTVTFDAATGIINPANGTFGATVTFAATLMRGAVPVDGKPIVFSLGGDTLTGVTSGGGHASVSWPLIQAPSSYTLSASFAGDVSDAASFATRAFTLNKAQPVLAISFVTPTPQNSGIVATLLDDHGIAMDQRTVYFVITNDAVPATSLTKTAITKSDGKASVGVFPLPPGAYHVRAYFLGTIPLLPSSANVVLTDEAYLASDSGAAQLYTASGPVPLTLKFTAADKDFDGTTAAVITGCSLLGVVNDPSVQCSFAGATASFADNYPGTFKTVTGTGFTLLNAAPGKYTFNSTAYTTADIDAVDPGNVLGAVVAADADFKALEDGFNVLFSKGASATVMTLRNTEPGTFHYLLSLDNESGIPLNSGNGAASTTIITIPGVPSNGVNVTIPASAAGLTNPAFSVQGGNPVRVHPDEGHDWDDETDLPAQVAYAYLSDTPGGLGDCLAAGVVWRTGQPGDGAAPKCLKVTGFDLPKRKKARIDINLEFRLKNTPNWLASQNPAVNFRAGFPFKSVTSVTLDSRWGAMAGTYPGNQITGVIGVGQSVTAVGGFVFDTNGGGISDAVVRVYNSPPSAPNMCTTTGQIATYTTMPDGFYFISQKGVNDASTQATGPNPLPSGVQYYIAICSVPGVGQPFWPARSIDHKLGNKEFDGEDFYVSAPSLMEVTTQPTSGRTASTLGTIKVSVKDAFGYVVVADNSTNVTITVPVGSGLTGTLTRKAVSGVATFSDLKFANTGTWTLLFTGSPTNWGSGTTSAPIVITR